MEQFSLEKYLENPSRKVVTRRGNLVRILCTDRKHGEDILPIVFLEESPDGIGEFLLSCRADGTCDNYDTQYDLFFADEEEKLTEFEKELNRIVTAFSATHAYMDETEIHHYSKGLLDLARKEIEKDIYDNGYRIGYETGKEETLQSMPRWKKVISGLTRKELFDMMYKYIVTPFEGYKDYYYLDKADLEKLPKEE